MKKYIYLTCALLLGAFASCSQSETGDETSPTNQVTLKVTADGGIQTRGEVIVADRFAIEVYTDATYTTPANVFTGETNKASNTTGLFSMVLDRTQAYYCLLWADKAGAAAYNIATTNGLKSVKLTGKAAEAWHGTKVIEAGTTANPSIELKRAVSKISLMQTGKIKAGTLTLNFNQPTVFNVADATTSVDVARPAETITLASDVDGTTTPVKLNTADIFVLSPVAIANLTDLTFKFGTEDEFTVSQAPLKANFNTNIKGNYTTKSIPTFTVTCEDAWGTTDNDEELPTPEASITWAEGNLVADGANGAKIGQPTDGGLYFQFGSLIGWSGGANGDGTGTPPTSLTLAVKVKPAGYMGTTWNNLWTGDPATENEVNGTGDPCKYYLKGTWRLPTKDEYEALFKDQGYPTTGPWKWDATLKSVTNNDLNLTFPASGFILYLNAILFNVGTDGYSWSASPSNDVYGYLLSISSSKVNPSFINYLASGVPVRCVQEK